MRKRFLVAERFIRKAGGVTLSALSKTRWVQRGAPTAT